MPRTLPLAIAGAATAGIAIGALAMTALNPKPLGYVAPTLPAVTLSQAPSETQPSSPAPSASTTAPVARTSSSAVEQPAGTSVPKPTVQQTMPRMMGAREDDAIALFRDLGVRNVTIVDVPVQTDQEDGFVQWQDPGHHMPIGPNTRVRLGIGRWLGTDESHITRAAQPTSQPTADATEGVTDESPARQDVVWSPVLPESQGNQQPCKPPAVYAPEKNACAMYR